jgi:hypothetical protein
LLELTLSAQITPAASGAIRLDIPQALNESQTDSIFPGAAKARAVLASHPFQLIATAAEKNVVLPRSRERGLAEVMTNELH